MPGMKRWSETEPDMLAFVHDFAGGWEFVERGSAREIGAPLKQFDVVAGVGQGTSGGKAGEAAADDGDGGALLGNDDHVRRRRNPFARMLSFSAVLSCTREEKTS